MWLLSGWNASRSKGTGCQVGRGMMPQCLARSSFTDKLWRPRASTADPQRHWCGTHKCRPSRRPTATLTASSSSLRPQEVMGSANSQCVEPETRGTRHARMVSLDWTPPSFFFFFFLLLLFTCSRDTSCIHLYPLVLYKLLVRDTCRRLHVSYVNTGGSRGQSGHAPYAVCQ